MSFETFAFGSKLLSYTVLLWEGAMSGSYGIESVAKIDADNASYIHELSSWIVGWPISHSEGRT